ncbi:hypothetical protein BCR43DRAFT_504894 [Syncephalastrum racemosum]|uniref:Uncharacterized protein n=1 Tax=Syncephalastrum racemosum TaxID=13706 RepID=A0A1X2HGL7_SYNRA|nr:hypothetical protein BCR43DRAFT_504894 [Syncephalastrum racemosum]
MFEHMHAGGAATKSRPTGDNEECGKNIKRSKDIPDALYDNLHREPDYPQFPFSDFAAYLTSVLRSDSYMSIFNMGQPDAVFDMFSNQHVDTNTKYFRFISRVMYQLCSLLEASGPLGTHDSARHATDHVKGAFGCHAMLETILEKYPSADERPAQPGLRYER